MKRTYTLLMIAALVMGMTQCRKNSVKPNAPQHDMITVTVSADLGGGKTEITPTGVVTWKEGDKVYYGKDANNISSTTISNVSVDKKSASFSITVEKGTDYHFYYCGEKELTTVNRTISFAEQDATDNGLTNIANKFHINYGTVHIPENGVPTKIAMNNIMSIGYFNFDSPIGESNFNDCEDIEMYGLPNAMTLTFNDNIFEVVKGGPIKLKAAGRQDRYVALVPASKGTENNAITLSFVGKGGTNITPSNERRIHTMKHGVVKNKFYVGKNNTNADPDPMTLTISTFRISDTVTVYFAPGNLYYNGSWHFENNQYDFRTCYGGPSMINGGFIEEDENDYYGLFYFPTYDNNNNHGMNYEGDSDDFCDWDNESIAYSGPQGTYATDGWFTLSWKQWSYLLTSRGNDCKKKFGLATITVNDKQVYGLVLLPDEWTTPSNCDFNISEKITFDESGGLISGINDCLSYTDNKYTIDEWEDMQTAGAVFIPAVGYRNNCDEYCNNGTSCYRFKPEEDKNNSILGLADGVITFNETYNDNDGRDIGTSVRLAHQF